MTHCRISVCARRATADSSKTGLVATHLQPRRLRDLRAGRGRRGDLGEVTGQPEPGGVDLARRLGNPDQGELVFAGLLALACPSKPIGSPVAAFDLRGFTAGCTLGGLRTDLDSRVLHLSGKPIEGLFAAGRRTSDGCDGGTPAAPRSATAVHRAGGAAARG